MRATLASLLVTSLVLGAAPSVADAAGPKKPAKAKAPAKKAPKKAPKKKGKGAAPDAAAGGDAGASPDAGASGGTGDAAAGGDATAAGAGAAGTGAAGAGGGLGGGTSAGGGLGGGTVGGGAGGAGGGTSGAGGSGGTTGGTAGGGSTPVVPTAQAKADAKKLVSEATKLYNVQEFIQAAELYKQAYLIDPNPAYLYASAQSHRLGGDCQKALLSYQAYLRASPPESERVKAEKNIERCEQEIRDKEAAVQAEQIESPYDVPRPPPPPPEEIVPPPPPPPPPPTKSYVLGHIMLGLGVIGLGGGTFLFIDGRSAIQSHNDSATYDEFIASSDEMDQAKQKQKIGVIAVGSGAALVTGAILFYVLHSRGGDETPPPVTVTGSAQGASVFFTRNF